MPTEPAPTTDTTVRNAARIAGISYAAMFVLAIYANFGVRMGLVDPDDAAATTQNLAQAPTSVRLAVAAFLVIFLLDVVVAWALFVLLRPVGPHRAMHAAWFRLAYAVLLGVATVCLFLALRLATADTYLDSLGVSGVSGPVMLALEAFDYAWLVGLACFGVHLILVGRILVTTRVAPVLLGWALLVAGVAYLADTFAQTVLPEYDAVAGVFLVLVGVPSVLGELAFTVWLLTRAGHSVTARLAASPQERRALTASQT